MSYEPFERCADSLKQATEILTELRQRHAVSAARTEAVHRRRRTADIALQMCFDELQRAFITPIDREDILLLRQTAEQTVCAAEDILLTLYRCGQPALSPDDTALLTAVSTEARLLKEAFAVFPLYPRQRTVLSRLADLEKQHRLCETLGGSPFAEMSLHRLSDTCFTASQILRRVLLKMV